MKKSSYQKAGVDIQKGDRFVELIKKINDKSPKDKKVLHLSHGYAALYPSGGNSYSAITTDGVGTKLKLAIETKNFQTIGIDLVAMCVNDLLCAGVKPKMFLDYFATSKLDLRVAESLMKGIAKGCALSECSLVGGETAEMPGLYQKGDFDLAGFAWGSVEKKKILGLKSLPKKFILLGIPSSGFHSNGYSLIRMWLKKDKKLKKHTKKLLEPTKIYLKEIDALHEKGLLLGAAHITGSGFLNVPRISENHDYHLELPIRSKLPEVFSWITPFYKMQAHERWTTFNSGIGLVLAIEEKNFKKVESIYHKKKIKFFSLGFAQKKSKKQKASQIFIHQGHESVVLCDE